MTVENVLNHRDASELLVHKQSKTHDLDKAPEAHREGEGHKSLINTLTHKDWHTGNKEVKMEKSTGKHLPNTEINDEKKNQLQERLLKLEHAVTDEKTDKKERLEAAHKMLAVNTKDVIIKDKGGQALHLHIKEEDRGTYTHIIVSRNSDTDNEKTLYLEGYLDKNGVAIDLDNSDANAKKPTIKEVHPEQATYHVSAHRTDLNPPHDDSVRLHIESAATHHQRLGKYPMAGIEERPDHHHRIGQSNLNQETVSHIVAANDLGETHPPSNIVPRTDRPQLASTTEVNNFQPSANDMDIRFNQARVASDNVIDKLIQLQGGGIYLRTSLAVDADGGADWKSDPTGQALTSLTNSDGSALDAKSVNYFVLPLGGQWKQMGVKPGDLAWVRNAATGKIVPAIFGDAGPSNKIGEGSQALCRALGLSDNPSSGGTNQKNIEFLIVPHSGNGKGDIASSAIAMADKLKASSVTA